MPVFIGNCPVFQRAVQTFTLFQKLATNFKPLLAPFRQHKNVMRHYTVYYRSVVQDLVPIIKLPAMMYSVALNI